MNLYIDIAISLILIFLVFSVIVYVLQELIAVNLNNRGRMLWRALAQVLDGASFQSPRAIGKEGLVAGVETSFTDLLFDHPQIQALKKGDETKKVDKTYPAYIPASNFAVALLEIVANKAPDKTGRLLEDFGSGLKTIAGKHPITGVLSSLSQVSPSLESLQKNIEKWYNDYMGRVSGWYQSRTVFSVRWLAIGVTLFFNLNCIQLVGDIAGDSVLRSNLVGISMRIADHPEIVTGLMDQRFKTDSAGIAKQYQTAIDGAGKDSVKQEVLRQQRDKAITDAVGKYTTQRIRDVRRLTDTLSAAHLSIGWGSQYLYKEFYSGEDEQRFFDGSKLFLALLGWLITAGCLSMGAPFWFNLLVQVVNVRRAGIKPKGDDK